ncbi:MAG: Do family serine endopeptidase [Roseovarius sp.]
MTTVLGAGGLAAQEQTASETTSEAPPTPASFAPVAKEIMPAVVSITSQRTPSEAENPMAGLPENHPLREFFEQFRDLPGNMPGPEGPRGPQGLPAQAAGSGFIIDAEGLVVTNNHVVETADNVSVALSDERVFDAEVIGTDPRTDLALLKIDADTDLPEVDWGASSDVEVGDWALAIGNPFGLGGSVTAGIVSARGRDIQAGPYSRFIQTDTAINRGSSGGPLFNASGEVVGVNTAILSPSGGNVGVGFALPSRVAEPIVSELQAEGEVTRGWLGVSVQPVTPEIAQGLDIAEPGGALISGLVEGSPAIEAGLREGDVITGFDERTVEDAGQLAWYASQGDPGDTVDLTVWRDGEKTSVQVTLGELSEQTARGEQAVPGDEDGDTSLAARALGIEVAKASGPAGEEFDLPQQVEGVVVAGVAPGSPAARQGLRPGHVIVQLGRQPVSTPEEFNDGLRAAIEQGMDGVVMLVQHGRSAQFVSVPLATPQPG